MSLNPQSSSVDLGPLSWVKAEIEHSLAEARTNLDRLAVDSADAKALKYVCTHLHQVTGALSMVGLGAATRFSEEVEALVESLNDPAGRHTFNDRIRLAKQATGSLSSYLDSLMVGEPDRPMVLAPTYLALNRGRGANTATESDLFSPDLDVVVPTPETTVALPRADMLAETIKERRSLYQAGLLKLLREKDLAGGARDMRSATLAIEALQVTSPTRAFWYTVSAFFDAVAANPVESGALAVQLFGKIDQQIKLLIEGVQKVPERLFRELLLVIGKSSATTERVRSVRLLYRLDELLGVAPESDTASDESVRTLVRSLRDQLQALKESWLKVASGNRAALESFVQQGELLAKTTQPLPNQGVAELLRVLGLVGPHLKKKGLMANEVQALEVASALLFVESSLENFFRLSDEFPAQSQAVIARIKGAMSGSALPDIDPSTNTTMDDFSKRAQERLLIFQVGQEVQVNLSTIESTLDAFFRDPQKTADLATLYPLFSQVQGALAMLELDEAAALNQMLQERVSQFASGAVKGTGEEAETVAEGVSALGLFVSALQQNSADPRSLLLPALIHFGLAEKPQEPERSLLKSPLSLPVSSVDVEVDKQKVQALYSDWKQQPDALAPREQLREAVLELKENAEITGDLDAAISSAKTLAAIDADSSHLHSSLIAPVEDALADALANIAPTKPAAAPAQQVVRLLDASAADVDRELLAIFLEEATEVVATIRASVDVVRQSPHVREAFTTIRRGFHTLKGSGRMVGLLDLGEVAWSCEQVMNKWIKEDKPLTDGLLKLLGDASNAFSAWVTVLQTSGTAVIDGTHITELCELLKNDREPVEKAVVDGGAVPTAPTEEPTARAEPNVIPADVFSGLSLDLVMTEAQEQSAENISAPTTELPVVAVSADRAADQLLAELPPLATTGRLSSSTDVLSGAPAAGAEREVTIGAITLPAPLFEIYLAEANTHIDTLRREIAAVEANPLGPISYEFMRAAHTLTSSSRTTGFVSIAEVAFALEKWLADVIELTPHWSQSRIEATRQGVDVAASMVLSLHAHEYPAQRPDVVASLTSLRESLQADARSGESSSVRLPMDHTETADDAGATGLPMTEETPSPFDFAIEVATEPVMTAADVDAPLPETFLPIEIAEPSAEAATKFSPETAFEIASTSALVAAVSTFAVEAIGGETETVDEQKAAAAVSPPDGVLPDIDAGADSAVEIAFKPAPSSAATAIDYFASISPPTAAIPALDAAASFNTAAAKNAEPEQFESGKDRRALKDDVDLDLLPIFLEEAREIMPLVGDSLRRWRVAPANHAPVAELARHLHTLKGSARMAGLMRLGELSHAMETRVIDMDRVIEPKPQDFDAIDDRLDRFNGVLDSLAAGDLAPTIDISPEANFAIADIGDLPSPLAAIAAARAEIVAEGEKLEGRDRHALLRVNADLIDRFVNEAGELAIARSRVDLELQTFKKALLDLNDNVARMKVQLREIEIGAETQIQSRIKEAETQGEQFDPLEFDRFSRMQELTRFMAESLNDVVTLQLSLAKNLDEADAALLQQSRLNRDLQQGLMGVRLVPLGNLQDRFYRLIRQAAKELDKKANLEFRGVRVEIDRSVLEKITAPFEHLLRNAVAHGIESPAVRVVTGKPEIGEISIDARQVGNEVILTLADDGAGLDYVRIREKAIAKGMLAADAAASDVQLTQFIFAAGFSTADTVSQLSGRGVGMDVVRNEIVSLGGRIDVSSMPGHGTTFTISLPLTLAVTQAVMVTVGEATYAIPSVMIEQVQEFRGKRYEPLLDMNEIDWKGNKYPLRSMEVMLGGKPKVSAQRHAFVILAKSGQQRAAVQVDDIIGNREIVVKSIGPQLARIPGIAGATVVGSGQIVLIMNPVQLVFREASAALVEPRLSNTSAAGENHQHGVSTTTQKGAEVSVPVGPSLAQAIAGSARDGGFVVDEAIQPARANPLVMVVDDSLTVRKITSRMLTRENFEVVTAKDGVDGLQQLQDVAPDVILLDIEMPRMDGFEFARNVRADAKTKHIPIIMITSRTADKHRKHALELGVNKYMGKPYQEEQLLGLIRQLTGRRTGP
ncbi:MAG: Hpt domain-containing protein [Burkholderiales bacterium]|jgi:chemosensory pili system protein ChpA (sensor histidine kinase/response regulator)